MNRAYIKWIGLSAIAVLAIFAASLALVAGPSPSPSPSGSAVPIPVTQQSTTSTQPKIAWSTSSVQPILSPGESSSSALSFVSSGNLTNITVEAVPEIASFVTIRPSSFASVPAGQTQPIQITFSVPQGTTLGTYDGTIHVRAGSVTFPQTLKITINVWQNVKETNFGFEAHFPSGWTFQRSTDVFNFFPPGLAADPSQEYAGDIILFVDENPQRLTAQLYYDGANAPALFQDAGTTENLIVDGLPAYRLTRVSTGIAPGDTVVIVFADRFIRIQAFGSPQVFDGIVNSFHRI
jgi:hypothetical protein